MAKKKNPKQKKVELKGTFRGVLEDEGEKKPSAKQLAAWKAAGARLKAQRAGETPAEETPKASKAKSKTKAKSKAKAKAKPTTKPKASTKKPRKAKKPTKGKGKRKTKKSGASTSKTKTMAEHAGAKRKARGSKRKVSASQAAAWERAEAAKAAKAAPKSKSKAKAKASKAKAKNKAKAKTKTKAKTAAKRAFAKANEQLTAERVASAGKRAVKRLKPLISAAQGERLAKAFEGVKTRKRRKPGAKAERKSLALADQMVGGKGFENVALGGRSGFTSKYGGSFALGKGGEFVVTKGGKGKKKRVSAKEMQKILRKEEKAAAKAGPSSSQRSTIRSPSRKGKPSSKAAHAALENLTGASVSPEALREGASAPKLSERTKASLENLLAEPTTRRSGELEPTTLKMQSSGGFVSPTIRYGEG